MQIEMVTLLFKEVPYKKANSTCKLCTDILIGCSMKARPGNKVIFVLTQTDNTLGYVRLPPVRVEYTFSESMGLCHAYVHTLVPALPFHSSYINYFLWSSIRTPTPADTYVGKPNLGKVNPLCNNQSTKKGPL